MTGHAVAPMVLVDAGWLLVLLVIAVVALGMHLRGLWRERREAGRRGDDDLPALILPVEPPSPARSRRGPAPAGVEGESVDGSTASGRSAVRTSPAPDGHADSAAADATLEFLPGRFEVVAGPFPGEIRFVKLAGAGSAITLGRARGEGHGHVQLPAPTVSGRHARMVFREGSWWITNLSDTNPLRLNGAALSPSVQEAGAALQDGDLVELGEVMLRFRSG